jgi:uncharacterized membrane protein
MNSKTKWALQMTWHDIEISLIVCLVAAVIVGTVVMISIGIIEAAEFFVGLIGPIEGWQFVRIFAIVGLILVLIVIFLAYRENLTICKREGLK